MNAIIEAIIVKGNFNVNFISINRLVISSQILQLLQSTKYKMQPIYKVNGYKYSFCCQSDKSQQYKTPKFVSKQFQSGDLNFCEKKSQQPICLQQKKQYGNKKNYRKRKYQLQQIPLTQNDSKLINQQQKHKQGVISHMNIKKQQSNKKIQLFLQQEQKVCPFFQKKGKTVAIQKEQSLIQLWNLNQTQNSKFHTHRFYKSSKTLNIRFYNGLKIKDKSNLFSKSMSQPKLQKKQKIIIINPLYLIQNFRNNQFNTSKIKLKQQKITLKQSKITLKQSKIKLKQSCQQLKPKQKFKIFKKQKSCKQNNNQNLRKNQRIEQMLKYSMQDDFIYIQA